jgi:hypothetical protein
MWFFSYAHVIRYSAYIIPLLSIIAGYVIAKLLSYKSRIFTILVLLLLSSTLIFSFALWAGMHFKSFPVVFGLETKEQFYSKLTNWNLYDAASFINNNLPGSSKILLFRDNGGYHIDRDYVWTLPYQAYFNWEELKSEEAILKRLKELNITHILINTNRFKIAGDYKDYSFFAIYPKHAMDLIDSITQKYAVKIYDKKGILIYELK